MHLYVKEENIEVLVDDRTTSPETTAIWLWTTEASTPPDILIHKLLDELITFPPALFPNASYEEKLLYF